MGIRLNKAIGYGLTDVVTEDYQITDPRINADSFLLDGDDNEKQPYANWLAKTYGDDMDAALELAMLTSSGPADAHRTVTWRAEYGLPHVLLVRPAGFPSWHRYDDPIDYEEEAVFGRTVEHRVSRTVGGIYPFNGVHMDAQTGERIHGTQVNVWSRVRHDVPDEDGDRTELLDALAKTMGYRDHAEAEQRVVPFVPHEVRRLCQWADLFTSPEVCFQLRPLLYVYWS